MLIDVTRDSLQKMINLLRSKNYWFGRYFNFYFVKFIVGKTRGTNVKLMSRDFPGRFHRKKGRYPQRDLYAHTYITKVVTWKRAPLEAIQLLSETLSHDK